MTTERDALERRVEELLALLEDEPALRAALPFTVDYLVGQMESALVEGRPAIAAAVGS